MSYHSASRAGRWGPMPLLVCSNNEDNTKRPAVTLKPMTEFRDRYEVMELLGKGRYGVVRRIVDRSTNEEFAAKIVRCREPKDRDRVREEITILNRLSHPRLLKLLHAYEGPRDVVLVTEYLPGGELSERIGSEDAVLNERDCAFFIRQICEALRYLHQQHVVHLDLKPENIMCHSRNSRQITLIDFGLAQNVHTGNPVKMLFGTPEFVPPEAINREPVGVESDMWAVGVICYILLSGLSPFMGDNDTDTFANITKLDYEFPEEAFGGVSDDAKDFIRGLLVKKKEERMTAKECLQHSWLALRDDSRSRFK